MLFVLILIYDPWNACHLGDVSHTVRRPIHAGHHSRVIENAESAIGQHPLFDRRVVDIELSRC
jgi:hypothetical protein